MELSFSFDDEEFLEHMIKCNIDGTKKILRKYDRRAKINIKHKTNKNNKPTKCPECGGYHDLPPPQKNNNHTLQMKPLSGVNYPPVVNHSSIATAEFKKWKNQDVGKGWDNGWEGSYATNHKTPHGKEYIDADKVWDSATVSHEWGSPSSLFETYESNPQFINTINKLKNYTIDDMKKYSNKIKEKIQSMTVIGGDSDTIYMQSNANKKYSAFNGIESVD